MLFKNKPQLFTAANLFYFTFVLVNFYSFKQLLDNEKHPVYSKAHCPWSQDG